MDEAVKRKLGREGAIPFLIQIMKNNISSDLLQVSTYVYISTRQDMSAYVSIRQHTYAEQYLFGPLAAQYVC